MRLASFLILIMLLGVLIPSPLGAQPPTQHVVLYAHDTGGLHTLTTCINLAGEKVANVSQGITFTLSPALGNSLDINGAILGTVYLQSDRVLQGILQFNMSELDKSGVITSVPGASIQTPIALGPRVSAYGVGMGPIQYSFRNSSSIIISLRLSPSTPGTPYLLWDDPLVPTSVDIQAVSPTKADIRLASSAQQYNRIMVLPNQQSAVNVSLLIAVTDALGFCRITESTASLTNLLNGTATTLSLQKSIKSTYNVQYSAFSLKLGPGQWQASFDIKYRTGDTYVGQESTWVAPFYPVQIKVVDNDTGNGLGNATVAVNFGQLVWVASTNATGWAILTLPATSVVGPLNATVTWKGLTLGPSPVKVEPGLTSVYFLVHLTRITLDVRIYGLPLPYANITLANINETIHGATGLNGDVSIHAIPGNYTVRINYLLSSYGTSLSVGKSDTAAIVSVPPDPLNALAAGIIALLAVATSVTLTMKRRVLYTNGFDYFRRLTSGGLPQTCFVLIVGNSGSGKTVLLETFAAEHIPEGKGVYVTNTEYPSKIREYMDQLGLHETNSNLLFIDAYSAIAGTQSSEEYSLSSHTDLTSLGLLMSKCLELAGKRTDVYLDSLNPLLAALRGDYLLNFLQSMAAKVKANEGRFFVTVGLGIEKVDMTKLEEASDCVIETQLQETRAGQRRRLRVKKLRGKPYSDKWTRFRVETGKGIVFLTKEKTVSSRE